MTAILRMYWFTYLNPSLYEVKNGIRDKVTWVRLFLVPSKESDSHVSGLVMQIGVISKRLPISLSRIHNHMIRKVDKKMSSEDQANGTMESGASTSDAAQIDPAIVPAAPKKRGIMIGVGLVILIVILAGAAFVGGRLLNGQGLPWLSSGGPQVFTSGGHTTIRISAGDIQPAEELPQTPADVEGIFDHSQDNSIFVGTGNVTMTVQKDRSGNVQPSASHTGPVVEVVVTTQTKFYHDTTMEQFNGPPPSGQKIQQVLEPGSLDEVGQYSDITVWGKKTGDRYIADILVYTSPAFIKGK